MKKLIALTLVFATLAGCSTVPFDETKPVSYGVGFLREGYMQNGEFVEQDHAREKIKTVPAAAEKLKSARAHQWGALGMIVGGVVLAEVSLANSDHAGTPAGYWIGLAAILGSIPFSIGAQTRYRQAGEEYNNARFTTTPKTSIYLSPVRDGGLAGLQVSF